MVGEYLLENYDTVDLNGDGVISYVMFKGQEGNAEAEARTQFGVDGRQLLCLTAGWQAPNWLTTTLPLTDKYLSIRAASGPLRLLTTTWPPSSPSIPRLTATWSS